MPTRSLRRRPSSLLALLALGAVAGCADDEAARDGRPTRATAPAPRDASTPATTPARGTALARDAARGVPTLWAADASPAGRAGGRAHHDPGEAAREHLRGLLGLYRASPAALDAARLVRVLDVGRGGLTAVFRQSIGGVEVFRRDVKVLLRRDRELVAVGGSLYGEVRTDAPAPVFASTPEEAVAAAIAHAHGVAVPASALRRGGTDAGGYVRLELARGGHGLTFTRPARVKRVLHPQGAELVAAYHVELISTADGEAELTLGLLVDATEGDVLFEGDLTRRESFAYDVFASADGAPRSPIADVAPHPTGEPDGVFPAYVPTRRIVQGGFNGNPDGRADAWLAPGSTKTNGNNVDAYTDGGADGFDGDDLRGAVTAAGVFGHVFDPARDPMGTTSQRMAAVTQLFYATNWLHDDWYDAGFDEAAGNAQAANFGRGGAEGDPLLAEAQDDAPRSMNNANMMTPADGASPRMQMYLWTGRGGGPLVDSDLDADVVAHEWGHYLHDRLTLCWSGICGAQGEGWGDFIALHLAVSKGDDLEGTFGMGAYAAAARNDAAYFGIRRLPYTRDLARNGLTFRHVADSADLPDAPSRPNGAPNAEVHNAGEVWTSMLWQAYSEMLLHATGSSPRYGFAEARRRMAEYVVAGMTLAPPDPDFTEQRDALLLAAHAADPSDAELLARGFAARGAGTCAVSPPKDDPSNEGVIESFELRSRLEVVAVTVLEDGAGCDGDGYLDRGERGRVEIVVRNAGWRTADDAHLAISEASGLLAFPGGSSASVPTLAPMTSTTVVIAVEPSELVDGSTAAALGIDLIDPGGCAALGTVEAGAFLESDPAPSTVDRFETRETSWSVTGTDGVWARSAPGTAHGAWRGLDLSVETDASLESPPIVVASGATFALSFTHRHAFESWGDDHWDGGVLEVSRDDGATWTDLGAFAPLAAQGVITGPSALFGRRAYVGRNPSHPERDRVTVDLGSAFSGETIRVRFRLATDPYVGDDGWEIDDVEVTGAEAPPFVGLVDDDGVCIDPADDDGAGGGGGLDGEAGGIPDGGGTGGDSATSTGTGPDADTGSGSGTGGGTGTGGETGTGTATGTGTGSGTGAGGGTGTDPGTTSTGTSTTATSGAGGAGGAGGAPGTDSGDGGASPTTTASGEPDDDGAGGSEPGDDEEPAPPGDGTDGEDGLEALFGRGCACEVASPSTSPAGWAGSLLALGAVWARRARRSR